MSGFHVGPIFVHAYGLAYVVAVAAAIALTTRRWERRGGARTLVHEVALWGFPAGLVGGRLYHLATSWNEVPHQWWGPLAIWQGGLGIWGGIAGGTLAGVWVLRRRHVDTVAFMDAAAPGLLVAQAIGRIGNYFNQELFGGPTTVPWGLEIDAAHRPVGYERFATFHPTFLYELLWNLALASVLIWLGRRQRIRAPGLFALYVAGYSLGRIGEELLRVDPAHHLFGLRLNLYVASVLCVAGLGWFARIQRLKVPWRRARSRPSALLLAGGIAAALCGCGQRATTTNRKPQSAQSPMVHVALAAANRAGGDLRGKPTCALFAVRRRVSGATSTTARRRPGVGVRGARPLGCEPPANLRRSRPASSRTTRTSAARLPVAGYSAVPVGILGTGLPLKLTLRVVGQWRPGTAMKRWRGASHSTTGSGSRGRS